MALMLDTKRLFDKVINFRLQRNTSPSRDDIVYVCPRTGIKPKISLQFEWLPHNNIKSITLTINNFSSNIDLLNYKYITITAGYLSANLFRTFTGTIYNIFQEAPNPNGTLVIQCILGNLISIARQSTVTLYNYDVSLVSKQVYKNRTIAYLDVLRRALEESTGEKFDADYDIPASWNTPDRFIPGYLYPNLSRELQGIQQFPSPAAFVSQINTWLQDYANAKGLPPVYVSLLTKSSTPNYYTITQQQTVRTSNVFKVSSSVVTESTTSLPVYMNTITHAYIAGGHGVILAPWNPLVEPGSTITVPAEYFRSAIRLDAFKRINKLNSKWKVNTVAVSFSTTGENRMQIDAVNDSILVLANLKEGV